MRLIDGSGLDEGNRATCRALVRTLRTSHRGVRLADMLAVAGRSGTLHHRMRAGPLEGRVRAKTGSIGGVVGMAGVADDMTFALVQNGVTAKADAHALEESVLSLLPAEAQRLAAP